MLSLLILSLGCAHAHVRKTLPESSFGKDTDAQLDFWHSLNDVKITTNNEAFHGLLLYFEGSDNSKDYSERLAALKSRHMIPQDFNAPADAAVTRGTLSLAIARGLHLRGGVMMMLSKGKCDRYTTRELQYIGVFPVSSPNQLFSGAEFVGVIGKIDDYQHGIATPVTNRLNEQ